MQNVITFCNQKGGVGKTTSCINLGCAIAKMGYKALIWDMDPQGNATSGVGVDKTSLTATCYEVLIGKISAADAVKNTAVDGLSIIPSNAQLTGAEIELVSALGREFILKRAIETLQSKWDFILIDCPPSLGLLTLNALTAAREIIIPLQCEYYALEGVEQLMTTFNLIRSSLNKTLEIGGVLLTMADFRTNLTEQVIQEVRKFFGPKVFNAVVPRSVRLSEAPSYGQPALVYDPDGKGSKAYIEAAKELIERKEKSLEQTDNSSRQDVSQSGEQLVSQNTDTQTQEV